MESETLQYTIVETVYAYQIDYVWIGGWVVLDVL